MRRVHGRCDAEGEKKEPILTWSGCDLRSDCRGLVGGGRGSDEAGEFGLFSLCNLLVHGRWCFYGAMDFSYAAEGNRICVCRPRRKEAPDCVGSAGWRAV